MRNNVSSKEKMEFAFQIARHTSATMSDVQRLLRYGATLGRIAEDQCNGYSKPIYTSAKPAYEWDAEAAERDEAKSARIKDKVFSVCHSFNCRAYFQGDPRGLTLRVKFQFAKDDWREIGVPTS